MSETLIECRGLSAGYGQLAVIRDLDLQVDAGEVVALIGRNGAGKTSTLLSLAGELKPMTRRSPLDGRSRPRRPCTSAAAPGSATSPRNAR